MKRLISLLLVLTMTVTCITAFALTEEDFWNVMGESMYSGEISFTMEIENQKEYIKDANAVDMAINGTDVSADVKYQVSPDFKKMKLYANVECSALDSLLATGIEQWLEVDLTERNAPKIKSISKTTSPYYEDGYMYSDITKPTITDVYAQYEAMLEAFDMENSETRNELMEMFKKYYDITCLENGFEVKISESDLKTIFKEVILYSIATQTEGLAEDADEDMKEYLENQVKEVNDFFAKLEHVDILAEDAYTAKVELNSDKQPLSQDGSIHVKTDANKVWNTLFASEDMPSIDMKKPEVDFYIKSYSLSSKINEDIEIEFPVLNEENSYANSDMYEVDGLGFNELNLVKSKSPFWYADLSKSGIVNKELKIVDGIIYIPLRESFEVAGMLPEEMVFNPDDSSIQVNSVAYYPVELKFFIDSPVYYEDGEKHEMSEGKIITLNDIAYMPAKMANDLYIGAYTRDFLDDEDKVTGAVVVIYSRYHLDYSADNEAYDEAYDEKYAYAETEEAPAMKIVNFISSFNAGGLKKGQKPVTLFDGLKQAAAVLGSRISELQGVRN